MSPLIVPSFGGGVVLAGSADTRKIDEILVGDSLDIGPRGALICASDASDYVVLDDRNVPAPWTRLYGFPPLASPASVLQGAVGEGYSAAAAYSYLLATFERENAASPIAGAGNIQVFSAPYTTGIQPVPTAQGVIVTAEVFPGMFSVVGPTQKVACVLVNLGAREGFAAASAPGLYLVTGVPPAIQWIAYSVDRFDALGTGERGNHLNGTNSHQLLFRGIQTFNNHAFGWGYDYADALYHEGPARVMFSNLGTPFAWGNDNQAAAGTDRAFTDSDAIVLGDSGELVRGALKWNGRLYFGTNQSLHWIGGYGRESFLTDGANPVAKAYNIVGPHGMIEGPDKLLYGVSDQGLWAFDGNSFEPHFKRLVDYDGHSADWWDLIWTDRARTAATYPGCTNQDLVWMAVDWDREQVLIGIPWCNATAGYGYGTDTVVIRFHTRTGGFTRQVFTGVQYTSVGYFRREGQQRGTSFMGTATAGEYTVQRYGYMATQASSAVIPANLPVAQFGPYSPFGPDGQGVIRRAYLTVSWTTLPLVFTMAIAVDESSVDTFQLSIQATAPVAPVTGDYWLDTSQSDSSIGNGTAGNGVPATGGYLLKTWSGTVWRFIAGQGGEGTRATIQLPLIRRTGTRVIFTATTTTASGRFQIESLGIAPGGGTADA